VNELPPKGSEAPAILHFTARVICDSRDKYDNRKGHCLALQKVLKAMGTTRAERQHFMSKVKWQYGWDRKPNPPMVIGRSGDFEALHG
jgi:hypothetical protein